MTALNEGSVDDNDYLGEYAASPLIVSCAHPNNAQPTHPAGLMKRSTNMHVTELVNNGPPALQAKGPHQP